MDYMHLGVRARKTGLNVRQGLQKDKYSMENIDDFFSEDSTSRVSEGRKSRRSSMLSLLSGANSLPFRSDFEQQQQQGQRFRVPASSSRRSSNLHRFSLNERDMIEEEPDLGIPSEDPPNVGISPPSETFEEPLDGPSIRLTPEKSPNSDIPDLIQDDEDTRDYTSFNTSENALLEDEMDDDYEVLSEEDRDYVDGESSLEQDRSSSISGGSSDSGGDETSGSDSVMSNDGVAMTLPSGQSYGYDGVPREVYDSDEEYIQKQAQNLGNEGYATNTSGLRKSKRVKIAPLEWWRNEKVVYKRKSNRPILEIDKIITYDKNNEEEEEENELNVGRRKRKKKATTKTRPYNYIPTGKPRGRPRKHKPANMQENFNPNTHLLEEINEGKVPSAEWLKHGILEANVNVTIDKTGDQIVAFAPNLAQSEQIKETDDEHFSLEVMFDKHKEHFASGVLKLPRYGKKKLSDSYNAFITFFVVQGVVEITLAGNTFISIEGSTFQVPAFNDYAFENRGNNEVKMFFTQVTVSADELHSSSPKSSDDEMQPQSSDEVEDIDHIREVAISRVGSDTAQENRRSTLSSMSISDI